MSDSTDTTPEDEQSSASDPDQSPASEDYESTGTSVLQETRAIDVDAYIAAQERSTRRAKSFLKFAAGIAVIAIPLTILRVTNHLSLGGITRPQAAAAPTTYSLGGPNTDSAAPAVLDTTATQIKKDPIIAADLSQYVYHDLKAINPDERSALVSYFAVTGAHFKGTQAVYSALQTEVIPSYTRFLDGAEAIHPKTAPVRAVHKTFVQSAKVKLLAFKHISEGEGDPDSSWQYGVKAEFAASEALANQFKTSVADLARIQEVKLP